MTTHPSLFGTVLTPRCHPSGIILSVLSVKGVMILFICPNYMTILVINEFLFPTCFSSFLHNHLSSAFRVNPLRFMYSNITGSGF